MSPQTLDPMKNLFSFYSRLKSLFFGVLIANTFFTITLSAQDEPSLSADLTAHFFSPQNVGLSSPQVADFTIRKSECQSIQRFVGYVDSSSRIQRQRFRSANVDQIRFIGIHSLQTSQSCRTQLVPEFRWCCIPKSERFAG